MLDSSSRLLTLLRDQSLARKILDSPAVGLGLADVEPCPIFSMVGQHQI